MVKRFPPSCSWGRRPVNSFPLKDSFCFKHLFHPHVSIKAGGESVHSFLLSIKKFYRTVKTGNIRIIIRFWPKNTFPEMVKVSLFRSDFGPQTPHRSV